VLERQDADDVPELRKLLQSESPQARVHAAWLLDSLVYLDEARLLKLLDDEHPRVRENAVKLAEVRLAKSKAVQDKLLAMQTDADPRVRCQVALALGQWDSDRIVPALAAIALQAGDDRWTRIAVASSLVGPEDEETLNPPKSRAFPVLEAIVQASGFRKLPRQQQAALLQDFAALMLNEPVGIRPAAMAQELRDPHLALALCNGFADGLARKGVRFDDYFFKAFPNPNNPTLAWLREFLAETGKLAAEPKAELPERLAAIRLLSRVSWQTGKSALPGLLADPLQEIRLAAVRGLATQRDQEVPALLMKNWRSYTPALRREVTEAMFRSPDRILVFLGEIENKRVKPGDLDALRTRQLLKHGQPNIRVLADKLLRGNLPADRQQVLKQYQAALAMDGDAKRGLDVFKKNCATCHRVAGVGIDVGPDIADTRTKTLAALLTDILSPNQAIDNNYVNYVVTTSDGKSATGIIVGETASSISLKRAEGQTETILRNQIDELSSTGVSLMPEGLEKTIPVSEMADLLAFLKNWRYLDGSVPLSK
jgi:putative heme-binding domain-containing protein